MHHDILLTSPQVTRLSSTSILVIAFLLLVTFAPLSGRAYENDLELPVAPAVSGAGPDLFTGTMGASIPLELPKGTHGMEPNLALVYRGGNGNGPTGVGWKLDMGGIERQSRLGVDYTKDLYVMKLNGTVTELVADPNIGGQFWARIQGGFSVVRKKMAQDGKPYWEVTDRKGTIYRFGDTAASRQDDPADASRIFRWGLTMATDPTLNYMKVTYTKDQGQLYLATIDYTGYKLGFAGDEDPLFHVQMWLKPSGNTTTLYTTGFPVTTKSVVGAISVKGKTKMIRAYQLLYTASPQTGVPLLQSVQQYGSDATIQASGAVVSGPTTLPETRLAYSTDDDPNRFVGLSSQPTSPCASGSPMGSADFNGDGQADVWCHEYSASAPTYVALSDANGALSWLTQPVMAQGWCASGYYFTTGDVNGDGVADLICHGNSTTYVLVNTVTGGVPTFTHPPDAGVWRQNWCAGGNNGNSSGYFGVGDFNGDGKTDIRCLEGGGVKVVITNPQSTAFIDAEGGQVWRTSWCNAAGDVFGTADFNGDGRMDISCRNAGDYRVSLSNGTQFVAGPNGDLWRSGWCSGAQFNGVADFNGDGKADWYCRVENASGPMWVQLSTGSAFVPGANGNTWQAGWCWSGAKVGTGDFNGDGKMDMYCHGSNATFIGLSDGKAFNFTTPDIWISDWCPDGALFAVGDFNGDGKADLWCRESSGTMSVARSGSSPGPADALVTLRNGLGGMTTVGYGYFTPQISQGAPFTLSKVTSLTTTDGNGVSAQTSFEYSGGYFHIGQREFRGFNQVVITGPPGPQGLSSEQRRTTISFHQGDNVNPTQDTNLAASAGYLKGKPYQIEVADIAGTVYQKRTITYAANKGGHAWQFNPPISVTDCERAACLKSRTTTYAYDEGFSPEEYGNVTTEIQAGTGTPSRTIIRQYAPNTNAWIIGLPFQETIREGAGTGGTIKANTAYLYDDFNSAANQCNGTATQGSITPTLGRVSSIARGVGTEVTTVRYGFDLGKRKTGPTCKMTENLSVWKYAYDVLGGSQLSRVTDPDGKKTDYTYNECGGSCSGLDATSAYGKLIRIKGQNEDTSDFEYDPVGRPTKKTVVYDESGNKYVTTSTYPGWGTVGQQRTEAVVTTDPVDPINPLGLLTATYFDGLQRTIKQTSTGPDGTTLVQTTEYDTRGNVRKKGVPYFTSQPNTAGTVFSYDVLGRPTKSVYPDGGMSQACEADWVRVTIDPRGLRMRQTRDAFGRVTLAEEFNAINATCDTGAGTPYASMAFQYDVIGNQLTATDIRGNQVQQAYNSHGWRTDLYDPDLGHWTYQYDAAGNVIQQTDMRGAGGGGLISFQYDKLNRLVQKDYGPPRSLGHAQADVKYKYSEGSIDGTTARGVGRMTTRSEGNGNKVQLVYDRIGRVIRRIQTISGDVKRTWFTYDGVDRPSSVQYYDNATVSYEYNGPWLKRVYESGTNYAQFANFTPAGQPGTLTLGNGVVTNYTYGVVGGGTSGCQAASFRLCTLMTTSGATTLQNLDYSYDANGNVTAIADPIAGNQSYTYDNTDRIMNAVGRAFNTQYTIDEIGNLTYTPNAGQYAYPTSGSGPRHGVCATGSSACGSGIQYSYDANGNMTGGAGRTEMQYDTGNRLTSVKTSGGAITTSFVYDGDGGRVKKTVTNGPTTTYFGQWVECENGQCVKYIWAGDRRVAMKQVSSGAVSYFHPNHLGSTDRVTNGTTGVQEERIGYYPFGEQWQDLNQPANVPYKYTGQEYDSSTGLYFYKSRYYDPHLGRFIQPDTIVSNPYKPQAWNRYSYVQNNPLKYTDPTGHFDEIPNSEDWSFADGVFTPSLTGYITTKIDSTSWGQQEISGKITTQYNTMNGINNTLAQATQKSIGMVTGYDPTATEFTLWYNPTEGQFFDLIESAKDKVGLTTEIAVQTANLLRGNAQSTWFLHSQAALIFSSAVEYLNLEGANLSNVSAVFNGPAANQWITGDVLDKAGVKVLGWNGEPGDFVYNVIGFNTLNPLRLLYSTIMLPTLYMPGVSRHCCYPYK